MNLHIGRTFALRPRYVFVFRSDRQFGPYVIRNQSQQLRRSLRGLEPEGILHIFKLSSPEEVEAVVIEPHPLWNNKRTEHGPFDIIGDVETGFDKHNVLTFSLDSSTANLPHGTAEEIRSVQLQEQIEDRVQNIPGVQADSFAFFTFNEGGWTDEVLFLGIPRTQSNNGEVFFNITGNGYFSTMGIRLVAGRLFNAQDTQMGNKVAVINETMARRFFPNGSAIGRRFGIGETPDHPGEKEVIGVVKDAKYTSLDEGRQMAAYFPCTKILDSLGTLRFAMLPGQTCRRSSRERAMPSPRSIQTF